MDGLGNLSSSTYNISTDLLGQTDTNGFQPQQRLRRAGATGQLDGLPRVDENSTTAIFTATEELLRAMIEINDVDPDEVASAFF